MYNDLLNKNFDYVIFGTSLTETVLSAYLAKSKKKILILESSNTYGGDCKNLNLREIEKLTSDLNKNLNSDIFFKNTKLIEKKSKVVEPIIENENYRQYNFDFNLKFIYANSKSVDELTNSNASNYIEFSSIKKIFFLFKDKFLNVPFSKSEIFMSNDLELLEKQKLLNFIFSIMKFKNNKVDVNSTVDIKKDIELDDDRLITDIKNNLNENADEFLTKYYNIKIKSMILLILANQNFDTLNMTVKEMTDNIYKFLMSVQIYGNTPLLYPIYGSSEFSQAMSRLASVYGGIFIVNEKLKYKVNVNKESLLNNNNKKYCIEIFDEENNKNNFVVFCDNIIINECFINNTLEFEKDINVNNLTNNNYVYKFSSFYCVKYIEELFSQKDGPYFYRVPKNEPELKNKYAFDVFKIFKNNTNVPKNRMLLQIIIVSDLNEKSEEEFIKNSQTLSELFINKMLENLKADINKNYNNNEFKKNIKLGDIKILEEQLKIEEEKKKLEDKKEIEKNEENKENIKNENKNNNENDHNPPKQNDNSEKYETISLNPEIILKYTFLNKINFNKYKYEAKSNDNKNHLIFTKNNFTSSDLDFYFYESEKIINEYNFPKIETETVQKKYNDDIDEEDLEENNLIDELFNEINLEEEDKKEEKEEKENKKDKNEDKKEEKENKKDKNDEIIEK